MQDHRFSCRVYLEDTDAGGIAYHASFLRFAERARTEALRELGVPHAVLLRDYGLIFVVRRVKLDYLRPARLDDVLEVRTAVLAAGWVAATLWQTVERAQERLAEAEVRLGCVRRETGRPTRLPQAWHDALERLAGSHR